MAVVKIGCILENGCPSNSYFGVEIHNRIRAKVLNLKGTLLGEVTPPPDFEPWEWKVIICAVTFIEQLVIGRLRAFNGLTHLFFRGAL